MDKDVSILVCSCDRYKDIWEPFFAFFNKYWSDCPYPVYLMTNREQYPDPSVTTIPTGRDTDWSSGFLRAIDQVGTKYIIILMEDYLLLQRPNRKFLDRSIEFMRTNKISYLRLFPRPQPNNQATAIEGVRIGEIDKHTDYRVSLQASIWHADYLKKLARVGESAWEFEIKGTERSNEMEARLFSVADEAEAPIVYFCTAVVKGYWVKEAVQICRRNNVRVDLKTRGLQPFHIRHNLTPMIRLIELGQAIAAKARNRLRPD